MNIDDAHKGEETIGAARICISFSTIGSRIGDICLGFGYAANGAAEKKVIGLNDDVFLQTNKITSTMIIRPVGGGHYPSLHARLHEKLRALNPAFKTATTDSRAQKDRTAKADIPQQGMIALPYDERPTECQLVAVFSPQEILLYTQQANGYPAHSGNKADWQIYRSPVLSLDRSKLSASWKKIVHAIAAEKARPRLDQERFDRYAVPFDIALTTNPNLDWVCSQ